MKLQPGTEVTPNVRLESLHAQGAMGSVWVAQHVTLGTKVAVKFISDRLDPDHPEVLERFVREAASAAQIKSSHVVQTFDQGVMQDGTPYIVMEFLEGEELRERLERERGMDLFDVVKIVHQTAKALSSAHKVGIIHRDIKPANLFLSTHDDEMHLKVFDFGIAKRRPVSADSAPLSVRSRTGGDVTLGLTNDGVMIGTPEYMSPEAVMSASTVDHQADLWSLAVVAYICLTGELPFQGRDVGELCVNLLESQYAPPTKLRPELGPDVDAWFAKALAQSIDQRFQSAREMALAFSQAIPLPSHPRVLPRADRNTPLGPSLSGADVSSQQGLPIATFSGSSADLLLPSGRRLSPAALAAMIAGVAAVTLVIGFLLFSGDDSSSPDEGTVEPTARPAREAASAPVEKAPLSPESQASAESQSDEAPESTVDGGSATPNATASGITPPRRPMRPPWMRPKPKDPGF